VAEQIDSIVSTRVDILTTSVSADLQELATNTEIFGAFDVKETTFQLVGLSNFQMKICTVHTASGPYTTRIGTVAPEVCESTNFTSADNPRPQA